MMLGLLKTNSSVCQMVPIPSERCPWITDLEQGPPS